MTLKTIEISSRTQFETLRDTVVRGADTIQRRLAATGGDPFDESAVDGISVSLGAETVGCEIHDVHGVGMMSGIKGGLIDECLFYHIGWVAPDRGHGHAGYMQNRKDSPDRVIRRSVFIKGFGETFIIYGTNGRIKDGNVFSPNNELANFLLKQDIFIGGRVLVGGQSLGGDNIRFVDCFFADALLQLGYGSSGGFGSVTQSVLTGGLIIQFRASAGHRDAEGRLQSWARLAVTGNKIYLPVGKQIVVDLPNTAGGWFWDGNEYSIDPANKTPFVIRRERPIDVLKGDYETLHPAEKLTVEQWRKLGFDRSSRFLPLSAEPVEAAYELGNGGRNVVRWGGSALTEGRRLFPVPELPIGYDKALFTSDKVTARRVDVVVTDGGDLQRQLDRLKATVADREQKIREDADAIRGLGATVTRLQEEGKEDKRIADAWRVLLAVRS